LSEPFCCGNHARYLLAPAVGSGERGVSTSLSQSGTRDRKMLVASDGASRHGAETPHGALGGRHVEQAQAYHSAPGDPPAAPRASSCMRSATAGKAKVQRANSTGRKCMRETRQRGRASSFKGAPSSSKRCFTCSLSLTPVVHLCLPPARIVTL
jgi:hypothetical protein